MPPTADAPPRLRFRTLRGRLAFVFLSLIFVLQTLTFLLVFQASREHALRQIEARLGIGVRIFQTIEKQRVRELNEQARLLAYDYGFKQAFGASINDPPTMRLAMKNWRDRVGASFFVLVSLEGKTLFDSEDAARDGAPFDLPELTAAAETAEDGEARGLSLRDGKPYAVVLVPLLAPDPEAWICLGFRIDDAFVRELGEVTRQAVSIVQQDGGWKIAATTHEARERAALADALERVPLVFGKPTHVALGGTRYVSLLAPLDLNNGRAAVLLQRDLDAELAQYDGLKIALIAVALAGLALSAAAALAIARSVAHPVLRLAQDARRVEQGDYAAHDGADVERADEIGQLAQSFQKMTAGLAERDRVRDLLGKVASPAIAAELLRREASLGGEERRVTVLFSDLQGFTALSERLPAAEVVAMLNAYFTRMSETVDAHGGVVDKFIGDALMALFGAPVEQPDHAAHALDAALEMVAALDALNAAGFASEIVQLGIGIHTDVVVAGIMGSPHRHNYTVIGDGVNIASRLQSLTRRADYDTRIIVSDAALREAGSGYETRPLGEAFVKGKAQPVTIHALIAGAAAVPR